MVFDLADRECAGVEIAAEHWWHARFELLPPPGIFEVRRPEEESAVSALLGTRVST